MDSTEERPAKRRCTRDPPEEEKDDETLPKYVDAWPTLVPPSLLQLCYRTLRATGRIQELEKDGRIPQETLQKFEKWTGKPGKPGRYRAKDLPWQDCSAWGSSPQCHNGPDEGEADTSKIITVCTSLDDGLRACVKCLKYWFLNPQFTKTDGIRSRIHIDYEGNYENLSKNNK